MDRPDLEELKRMAVRLMATFEEFDDFQELYTFSHAASYQNVWDESDWGELRDAAQADADSPT